MLELVEGRAEVNEDGDDGDVTLRYRSPEAADRDRFVAYLGHDAPRGGTAYVVSLAPETPATAHDTRRRGLRSVGARLGELDAGVLTTATGLANWHLRHGFCPRCGSPTTSGQSGWVRVCPHDESEHYPRTDPAVIMSVIDDQNRLLLARGVGSASPGMSVLAGFVEPGESLAGAVAREVQEEVGIGVTDIDYLGDQPWPFPASLMVGFTARALSTDLTLQESEIESAQWFDRDEFSRSIADGSLRIPGRISIARRLIEHWYGEEIDVADAPLRG